MTTFKTIAFCTPVMNRDEDLKSTLAHNLTVLKNYSGRAKLYVHIFNESNDLLHWVESNFKSDIESGLLVVKSLAALRYWHFSWAKNSFKSFISEEYYSSLDGDNFLTLDTVSLLFDLIHAHDEVLFHGFSGTWGDGTCGQLTLPTRVYKKYGYLNSIYPRQYDENGLIARALYGESELVYASYEGVDITVKSGAFKKATEFSSINNTRHQVPKKLKDTPLNPKGAGYVEKDKCLSYFQNFNEAYTFLKCLDGQEAQAFHREKLFRSLTLLNTELIPSILSITFEFNNSAEYSNDLTVYSVIKNDEVFINDWLAHYRKLGVKRFIIVDDHSEKSLCEVIEDISDVYLFKPIAGDFKSCKVYWLKLLMMAYQVEDSWVMTVDSDEFLSLGKRFSHLTGYTALLNDKGMNYGPAMLIDMLPRSNFDIASFTGERFEAEFNQFYLRPAIEQPSYYNHHSVSWGFGKFAEYSYRLDCRWRFFSTFDSLRKIPIFRYCNAVNLNQGFHTLAYSNTVITAEQMYSDSEVILPIKHYKFVSYFLKQENSTDGYHSRTKANLEQIRKKDRHQLHKEFTISPFVHNFSDSLFSSIFFKRIGLYRIIGNDIGGLHSDEQTFRNLKFILEREPNFEDVDKYFVLNRITDRSKAQKYINLLKAHDARYLEIEFDSKEYSSIKLDDNSLPTNYQINSDWDKLCAQVMKRESRNRYAINNNGARNFALSHGKQRHEWTLPWDGNCFVNELIMEQLRAKMRSAKYLVVPMERVIQNEPSLVTQLPQNAVEEPQLCFRKDSSELFNPNYFYGYQPKVELLKRLGVPGSWHNLTEIYPWKPCSIKPSSDAGDFSFASAVYRLSSGNRQTTACSVSRGHARSQGIIDYLDKLSHSCSCAD